MTVIIDGTNGITNVNGSAAVPAETGTDTDTGLFFPAADTIAFSEGGVEALRLNSSGQIAASTDGTASVPVFTRSNDTNTGLFFPAADTVAASVGGAEGLRLTSTGLGVGTTSPGARIQAAGDISSVGGRFRGNTSGTTLADGASTTVDGGFGGLLIIGLGSGSSAHFYCPYSTGTSLIRSDVVGTSFSATDSGTAVRIFKSNNSTTVTIKNSSGGSAVIYVTVYTGF